MVSPQNNRKITKTLCKCTIKDCRNTTFPTRRQYHGATWQKPSPKMSAIMPVMMVKMKWTQLRVKTLLFGAIQRDLLPKAKMHISIFHARSFYFYLNEIMTSKYPQVLWKPFLSFTFRNPLILQYIFCVSSPNPIRALSPFYLILIT